VLVVMFVRFVNADRGGVYRQMIDIGSEYI
jgi:hypothetical protein